MKTKTIKEREFEKLLALRDIQLDMSSYMPDPLRLPDFWAGYFEIDTDKPIKEK